ncbi:MAG: amidohydrolase family protein [Dehalococcoidia bacterium]
MIDSQVHIWSRENLPDGNRLEFARRAARTRLPYRNPLDIVPRVGQVTWDPEAETLLAFLDANDIAVAINQVCDFGPCFGEECAWSIAQIHDHAADLCRRHPGRIAFACGVDPRRHDALDELRRCVTELGAVAWQCFPANGYRPDDRICYRLFETCLELGIPAVIRTGDGDIGPYTGFSHPFYVENVARDFRELEIVMEHAGGGLDMLWREATMIARVNPNVSLQLGLWQSGAAIFGGPRSPARLGEFVGVLHVMREAVGAHRILWGSDHMRGQNEESNRQWVELWRNLPARAAEFGYGFDEAEVRLMTDENARRIFQLPA